jgi:hypothetical protein
LESDHLAEHLQWAATAAVVAMAIVLVSLIVRELRFASSFGATSDAAGATVLPREAVSVPTLVLAEGRHVRVGESRSDALAQLASLKLLKRIDEAGPLGAREVRSYQGVTLVFEPFERAGDPRVAAIYLQ